MRARLLLFVAGLWAGCFSDTPESTGCPVGSKGCACTAGGACDAALECHAQSQNCYDPECDEGSQNCPCFDDMCFAGLACIDGYCEMPDEGSSGSPSTDGVATAETTVVDPSTATDTGAGTMGSGADMTGQTGSSDPTVDDGSDSSDPGEACRACFVDQAPIDCSMALSTCMEGLSCGTAWTCLEGGSSFAECCRVVGDGVELWNELASCIDGTMCSADCSTTITTC